MTDTPSRLAYTEEQKKAFRDQFADMRFRRQGYLVPFVILYVIIFYIRIEHAEEAFGLSLRTWKVLELISIVGGVFFAFRKWQCPACGKPFGFQFRFQNCKKCGIALQ